MNSAVRATDPPLSEQMLALMERISIFDALNLEERRVIARHLKTVSLKPGETLFTEGDRGDYLCFVAAGELEVLKKTEEGQQVALIVLKAGDTLGEMAVIESYPRSATVRAASEATLAILSGSAFERILARPSRAGIKLLKEISKILSRNLRETSSRLARTMLPIS